MKILLTFLGLLGNAMAMPVSIFQIVGFLFLFLGTTVELISTAVLHLSLIFSHFQMHMPRMPGFSSKSEEVCIFSVREGVFYRPFLEVH